MSTRQLINELLALPLSERIDVAQSLWESIHDAAGADEDREAIELAKRRNVEMSDGTAEGRTHETVMAAARPKG